MPAITMGIVLVAFLAARIVLVPSCYHDDINLETHQLSRKLRGPIELPLRISVLDGNVLSFYVAKIAQSQPNCLGTGGLTSCDRPTIDTLSEGPSSAAAPDAEKLSAKQHSAKRKDCNFYLHVFFFASIHATLDPRHRPFS